MSCCWLLGVRVPLGASGTNEFGNVALPGFRSVARCENTCWLTRLSKEARTACRSACKLMEAAGDLEENTLVELSIRFFCAYVGMLTLRAIHKIANFLITFQFLQLEYIIAQEGQILFDENPSMSYHPSSIFKQKIPTDTTEISVSKPEVFCEVVNKPDKQMNRDRVFSLPKRVDVHLCLFAQYRLLFPNWFESISDGKSTHYLQTFWMVL